MEEPTTDKTCAVMIEPMTEGEGGVNIPSVSTLSSFDISARRKD